MQLTSQVFQNNDFIPKEYSCEGQGIHPPLLISDIPEGTKSLALIVDDPDAPMGTFVHWVIFNFPPLGEITEGEIPAGAVRGKNTTGQTNWVAPCPPNGTHRYRFYLWALSQPLPLKEGATREEVETEAEKVKIGKTELIGLYERQE